MISKNKTRVVMTVLTAAFILAISLAAFLPVGTVAAAAENKGGPGGGGGYGGCGETCDGTPAGGGVRQGYSSGVSLTPLSDEEKTALQDAILEEYGAYNLYNAIIDQFGEVNPFVRIVRSEQMHANVLIRQAEKYGVEVPENPGLTTPVSYSSLVEACQAGIDTEVADGALYDELMAVTTHTDLLRVYERLQWVSLNNHLPAFEACN